MIGEGGADDGKSGRSGEGANERIGDVGDEVVEVVVRGTGCNKDGSVATGVLPELTPAAGGVITIAVVVALLVFVVADDRRERGFVVVVGFGRGSGRSSF